MVLKSDAILKGPIWAETIDKMVDRNGGKIFKTNWDLYALSITIGMMYDCQIDSDNMVPEGYDADPRYVPRNVLGDVQRKTLLEFMLQSAMITTKHLDLSEGERLEIAFNDNKKLDFNPVAFLTKFANFGVSKIKDIIDDTDDVEMLESLMTFLNSTYESGISGTGGNDDIDLVEDIDLGDD